MPVRPLLPRRSAAAVVTVLSALALAACSASDDGAGESSGATHTIEHARGETEVPEAPQRVVVLEPVQLDTAVALGATPVGTTVLSETTGVPEYLGEEAADIEMMGTVPEPSVERIASVEPDLILGTESRHSALYDQLSDIAPTVFMESHIDPWQENAAFIAEALGDPDGADQLFTAYDERCAEIAEQYETEGRTAQLVRPRDGILTLYGPESFAGGTLECAGFTTPEHDWEDISLDVSPERVLDAQADLVLVTSEDPDDPSTMPPALEDNAGSFPELHLVDQSFWITGVGPKGGMTVLDDLERILAAQ